MSGESQGSHHNVIDTIKKGAAVGCLALAGYGAVGLLEHELDIRVPGISIKLPDRSNTPPIAQAAVNSQTYQAFTTDIRCADEISVDVGVTDHSRFAWISGYEENHIYPVRFLECGTDGYQVSGVKKSLADGKVISVTVAETNYSPTNAGVDFNDGAVLCMNLPATATLQQIKQAQETYDRERANNKTLNCDFGQNTTGAGIVTPEVVAADTVASYTLAQDAAALSPVPNPLQQKVINTVTKQTKAQLSNDYPGAKIMVKPPKLESPINQIEADWIENGEDITYSLSSYKLVNPPNGDSEMEVTSVYNGAKGTIILPIRLLNSQLSKLNAFMHKGMSR